MKDRELADMLGGAERLVKLRAAGLPAQQSMTVELGPENLREVVEIESDRGYLLRVIAWLWAHETRRQFLDAQAVSNTPAMRAAIAKHLQGFLDGSLVDVDREIAAALMIALKQSASGEIPDLFAPPPRRRGERVEGLALRSCIEAAGRYIVFCLAHTERWIDRNPVKTVAELYGVSHRQASRWKDRVPDDDVLLSRTRQPELGEPRTQHFRQLRASMRSGAAQYARFGGQAASAIRARNR